jgi:hypothetical protein
MSCENAENLVRVRDALATARAALHPVRGLAPRTDVVILELYDDIEITHTKICQEIGQHVANCQSCKQT